MCRTAVSLLVIFILHCWLPPWGILLGQLGLSFVCKWLHWVFFFFLPSLHPIVWEKEDMHSEEERGLEGIGQY